MKALSLLSSSLIVVSLAATGCQQQQATPRSAASATPTLTSSPVPPPEPPHPPGHPGSMAGSGSMHHPPPSPQGPRWHGGGEENVHVYKFDFILTPKDPKDTTLTPTSFTINIAENNSGEVTIGRNVALQAGVTAPSPAAGGPPAFHGSPRQDVGLKVKAHPRGLPGTEDMVLDVTLEMSSVEGQTNGAASIRKLTTQGSAVVALGKSALIMSVDDASKHYDLTVTTTKLR